VSRKTERNRKRWKPTKEDIIKWTADLHPFGKRSKKLGTRMYVIFDLQVDGSCEVAVSDHILDSKSIHVAGLGHSILRKSNIVLASWTRIFVGTLGGADWL
jgi:hypothetical protein